jgi:hypothetical protein
MFFKNVMGPYLPFYCDILTGKRGQWHSSFPQVISHGGSLKKSISLDLEVSFSWQHLENSSLTDEL